MRALLPLVLAAACASRAPSFREEISAARFEISRDPNRSPAPAVGASGAMRKSVAEAEAFLARSPDDATALALLACARLARGETALARAAMERWRERIPISTRRGVNLAEAASHAVTACRAIEARAALASVLAANAPVEGFAKEYGDLLGGVGEADLRALVAAKLPNDPRELERTATGRRELRRRLGEQLYDDIAALVSHLRWIRGKETEGADVYLTRLSVGLLCAWARMMPDLLPEHLSEEQKQWFREQALGVFERTREQLAGLEDLRAPLDDAQEVVFAWISTR